MVCGLHAVPVTELVLNDRREGRHLCGPACGVVLLEALQQLVEHHVQLLRGVVPLDDSITEPQ